jgi:ketosteroid isomerase-like protein
VGMTIASRTTTKGRAMASHSDDIAEITDLMNRWGFLLDDRDWDNLGDCLTDDAVYDGSVFGFDPVQGLDNIRAVLRDGKHASAHHATNVIVDFGTDGEPVVRSKGIGVQEDGTVKSAAYEDEMRKTPAGWRISKRKLTVPDR